MQDGPTGPENDIAQGGDEAVLTRNDQLTMKSSRKKARGKKGDTSNAKVGKRKGKGKTSKKSTRGKRGSGKKKVCKASSSSFLEGRVSRKRQILKGGSPTKHQKLQDETGASSLTPTPADDVLEMEPSPAPKTKGKTVKQRKGQGKTDPKPKAKTRATAKKDTKAATPAAPKAKAKAKAKASTKSRRPRGLAAEPVPYDASLTKAMLDFASQFGADDSVRSMTYKDQVRQSLDQDLSEHRLKIYWTRCTCGITDLEADKDLSHFGFNHSSAIEPHKCAVAIKCAHFVVP